MALERKLNKMRSFTFPRILTSSPKLDEQHEDKMASFVPSHSRQSSSASSSSSPLTPTFSTRSHARWPSSCSSLTSAPDSPVNVAKVTLEDLVEEAGERDDVVYYDEPEFIDDQPYCICDSPYCEHQRPIALPSTPSSLAGPEWTRGDDSAYHHDVSIQPRMKRSSSTEFASSVFGSRRQQRWNSLTNRWHSRRPTTSISSQTVRSAPPTPRSSSSRRPSASQSLISSLGPYQPEPTSNSPTKLFPDQTWTTSVVEQNHDLDATPQGPIEDPIDREAMSSTPLLPHLLTELRDSLHEPVQSPLQSPTVAAVSETASIANASICSPALTGLMTPPLSAKPSVTSMSARPPFGPPAEEPDRWAIKLGHSDFDIEPKPYYPRNCTAESCKQLLDDWEVARKEYMRVIARVNEHHGPSSPVYKLTEEKWSEIDKEWRANFEWAHAEAEANGETPTNRCLAQTQPLSKMPSLVDPNQPEKFLKVNEEDIVGPMVQYVKYQPPPTTRTGLFTALKDSTMLLGRSVFAPRR